MLYNKEFVPCCECGNSPVFVKNIFFDTVYLKCLTCNTRTNGYKKNDYANAVREWKEINKEGVMI